MVLEEIDTRSKAMTELFKIVGDAYASKPDEQEVDAINANYQQKAA